MARRLGALLAERALSQFLGRAAELERFDALLEAGSTLRVVHVHGLPGIGKSSLLDAFAGRARERGAIALQLDGHAFEPTERGFSRELASAIGHDGVGAKRVDVASLASRLSALGGRVVLLLDHVERLRLLDTWLRQRFAPSLGENVRLVLAGREPPATGWLASAAWRGVFEAWPLGPLSPAEVQALVARSGVPPERAGRLERIARGHPLALQLALSTASADGDPTGALEDTTEPRVIHALAHLFLAGIEDPLTRRALEAACLVRRATQPLLRALLPDVAPEDAFERLGALPFVEAARDGLRVHDAVQEAIATALHAADPARHRALRRAAWQALRDEATSAPRVDLWRTTADLLFLIENPVVREAFFPSGGPTLSVEPADARDAAQISAIVARHEPPAAAEALLGWWQVAPEAFSVARDGARRVEALYVAFEPASARGEGPVDPLVAAWLRDLARRPLGRGERALFLRRWLAREQGEAPSPLQAACWLDVKRTYLALRPRLRRVYTAVAHPEPWERPVRGLHFRRLEPAESEIGGHPYTSFVLDMGPRSVDGWLARLSADELGLDDDVTLDPEAGELRVDGAVRTLTPLELGLLVRLRRNADEVVSRDTLLRDVWGYEHTGSNVVDAVVRSLRRKLGRHAARLESSRGYGYRWRDG